MILIGCGHMEARLNKAATTQGTIKAGVDLPDQPDECRQHMPRFYPSLKEKPRDTQLRWEFVADNEDKKTDRCALFNDNVKTNYGAAVKGN
jgi:hypothetical protein